MWSTVSSGSKVSNGTPFDMDGTGCPMVGCSLEVRATLLFVVTRSYEDDVFEGTHTVPLRMVATVTVTVTGLSLRCLFPERSQVTEGWLLPQKPSHRASKKKPQFYFFAKCFYPSYLFNWELVTPLFPIIPGPYILIFVISNQPSMLPIFF